MILETALLFWYFEPIHYSHQNLNKNIFFSRDHFVFCDLYHTFTKLAVGCQRENKSLSPDISTFLGWLNHRPCRKTAQEAPCRAHSEVDDGHICKFFRLLNIPSSDSAFSTSPSSTSPFTNSLLISPSNSTYRTYKTYILKNTISRWLSIFINEKKVWKNTMEIIFISSFKK